MAKHVLPVIGEIRVDRIGREDVLRILTPIWASTPDIARKQRNRIRAVLSWCQAHGFIEHNVAGEMINGALPSMPAVKAHYRALPYKDVPIALETIDSSNGAAAAAYLEKATDHKGWPRAGVAVLRGDPVLVGQVADSLGFKHRTTSAVIAWTPEDNPSPSDISDVLDSFERLAWAGLEPDRSAWCAIRHDDEPGGGIHVHILAARVDLETGKSLNIAPPGWQRDFGPWRDYHNIRHGWATPDDPARARAVRLNDHEETINADLSRDGKGKLINPREQLTDILTMQITAGLITNRADILSTLKEYGEITRAGKDYISLKPDGEDKAIRLRGSIYDEHFNTAAYRAADPETDRAGSVDRPSPVSELDTVREKLEAAHQRRAQYNRRKYGSAATRDQGVPDPSLDLPPDSDPPGRARHPERVGYRELSDNQPGANPATTPPNHQGPGTGGNTTRRPGRDPVPGAARGRKKTRRVQSDDRPLGRDPGGVSDDRTRKSYGGEDAGAYRKPDPLGAAIERNQPALERSRRNAKRMRRTLETAWAVFRVVVAEYVTFLKEMDKATRRLHDIWR